MNIHTYLMIKSAAGLGQPTSDDLWRTTRRALENADQAADYKNQLAALQGNYDKANAEIDRLQGLVDNGDAERLRMIRDIDNLHGQFADYRNNAEQYEKEVKGKLSDYEAQVAGLNDQISGYKGQIGGLNDQIGGLNNKLHNAENDAKLYKRIAGDNGNIANLNRDVALGFSNTGKKLTTYGGAGIGAGLGGAAGYGLANWGGKKLGLKGNKALALNILGTTAGAGLGGYGGYRLGQYAGDRLFDTNHLIRVTHDD